MDVEVELELEVMVYFELNGRLYSYHYSQSGKKSARYRHEYIVQLDPKSEYRYRMLLLLCADQYRVSICQ